MANKISKVIARKSRSTQNPNLGYIRPVFKFEDSNLAYTKVYQPSEFPNDGEVFVFGGYDYIENCVDFTDFFEIEISENETNYDPDRFGSCQYSASSSSFRKLEPQEFVSIFSNQFDLEKKPLKACHLWMMTILFS